MPLITEHLLLLAPILAIVLEKQECSILTAISTESGKARISDMLTTQKVIATASTGKTEMTSQPKKLLTAWPKTACLITASIEEMYNSKNVKNLSLSGKLKSNSPLAQKEMMFVKNKKEVSA